jgi:hypothetical protein
VGFGVEANSRVRDVRRVALPRQFAHASQHRRSARRFSGASLLRDVLAHMPSEDFVDEGLIPDAAPACFLTELIEHSSIDSNRNDLARFVAERRPTDAPHGLQLVRRRIGNLREVNLAPRTPHARGGSPAVR